MISVPGFLKPKHLSQHIILVLLAHRHHVREQQQSMAVPHGSTVTLRTVCPAGMLSLTLSK